MRLTDEGARQLLELRALNLVGNRERQRVDEGDVAGRLVVGQPRQGVLDDAACNGLALLG